MSLPDLVRSGDNKAVRKYLRNHRVSKANLSGALIVAIRMNYLNIIKTILKTQLSHDQLNDALLEAFDSKNLKTIELLLKYSDESLKIRYGLVAAADKGYLNLVKSAIKLPHVTYNNINDAFVKAASNTHVSIAEVLLSTGKVSDKSINSGFYFLAKNPYANHIDSMVVFDLLFSTGKVEDKIINSSFVILSDGHDDKRISKLISYLLKTNRIADYSINQALTYISKAGHFESGVILLKTGRVTEKTINESIVLAMRIPAYRLVKYIIRNCDTTALTSTVIQESLSINFTNYSGINTKYLQFILDGFYIDQDSIKDSMRRRGYSMPINILYMLLYNVYDASVIDRFLMYQTYVADSNYVRVLLDNGLYKEELIESIHKDVKSWPLDVKTIPLDNLNDIDNIDDVNEEYFTLK